MRFTIIFLASLFICSCSNYLEKNYELEYDPNDDIFLITSNSGIQQVIIPSHILFYGHNSDFIIACQKPVEEIYLANSHLQNYDMMMNKIVNTKLSQFWIVGLKNDKVYGPLSKSEYLLLRKNLKIPKNLNLNKSTISYYNKDERLHIEYKFPDNTVINIQN